MSSSRGNGPRLGSPGSRTGLATRVAADSPTPTLLPGHGPLDTPSVVGILALVALFAVAFAAPSVADFTIADVAIAGLILALTVAAVTDGGRIDREARMLFPGLALIAAGTLLGSTHVGLQSWILADGVRDLGAFLAFFAMADALRRLSSRHLAFGPWMVVAGMTALTLHLWVDGGGAERASATFPNPNVPGHYLATAIGLCAWTLRGRARVVAVTIGLAGLAATGSFGGALQVVMMAAYAAVANRRLLAGAVRRRPWLVVVGLAIIPMTVVLYTSLAAASSPDRLDRSGSQRVELWQDTVAVARDNPLGVGPGTIRHEALLGLGREPHSEYLAYLGERGVVGLGGLLVLGLGLARLGRPGGGLRMLLVGLAVASLFRETMHYRHLWLFLAFVLAWDERWLPTGTDAREARGTVTQADRGTTLLPA